VLSRSVFPRAIAAGLGLLALAVLGSAAQQARPVQHRHKNVLLIVLDDLGTDKLSFYGDTPPTCPGGACQPAPNCTAIPANCVADYAPTPNLQALREQGILFTRAYASPVCSSTRAYMQTGRYGFRTGIGRATSTVQVPGDYELQNSEKCLSELLREGFSNTNGAQVGLPYRCGAFGKWHLSTTLAADRGHAVENGYHRFRGTQGNLGNHFRYDKVEQDEGSGPVTVPIDGTLTSPAFGTDTWSASVTRRDALQWMRAQRNSFFAYVCFNPPHAPIQVPPLALLSNETQCALACAGLEAGDILTAQGDPLELVKLVHRAMIEAVDAEIGNLVNGLSASQRADTMILVMGDNGTVSFAVDEPPHEADHAKGAVFELGIRVPLLVSGPLVGAPVPPGGWQSDALVSAVDLWRTIADITGADAASVVPLDQLDGESFLPVVIDPLQPGPRTLAFSQTFSPNGTVGVPPPSCYTINLRSLSNGEYKYLRSQGGVLGSPCGTPLYFEGLYHVASDPEEMTELITGGLTPPAAAALALLQAEMDALSGH
jgi:arylsulfatase A-like enzyme